MPLLPSFLRRGSGDSSQVVKSGPADVPTQAAAANAAQGLDFGSPFSPGAPLTPFSGYGGLPRAHDYSTGRNIVSRAERDKRVSFDVLKSLIDNYDIARMAIGHRIDDVRSLDWSIVPAKGISGDVDAAIDTATEIMRRPEGPGSKLPLRAWLAKYLEDVLRYDAGCLYRRRDRVGRVIGLKVVSGPTIAPLLDYWGDTPLPPAPAFVQFVSGTPWKWLTADDLIYVPFRPQPDSPYGFAPLESVLLTANTDLRFQMHFLNYFTEGTVPSGFATLAPDLNSPTQIAEFQEYYDALLYGDDTAKHQIKWVPNGTTFEWPREETFDSQFPLYLMRKVAAAYHVTPNDLGFTDDVNRASSDTQVDVQFRVGTLPLVQHVQDIFTDYLQDDRGLPVEFRFDTGQEKEDRLQEAQAWAIYIQNGLASVDEGRQQLLGLPTDNERKTGRYVFTARGGPIPLSALDAVAGPIDPETGAPAEGAALPHKPFSPVEGVAPQKPAAAPPLAVVAYPADNQASAQAAVADANAAVTKELTAGVTTNTGIVGMDLLEDDEDDEDAEMVKAAELASFRRFAKARRRAGKWRDFTFTALDPVSAHRLNDSGRAQVRKADGDPVAAGLAVRAADTGRVLMLQRAMDPDDPAAGTWEFPGGHIEDGEQPLDAACREWQEETGCLIPQGTTVGDTWASPDGVYHGFIASVPSEASLPILHRGQVANPDDPDGDVVEAIAWWDPATLPGNPAVRPELAADLPTVLAALAPNLVAKEADRPKASSWRDGASKTPQHSYDLRLTDHYAPQITNALTALLPVSKLRAVIEQVASTVAKAVDPRTDMLRTAAKDALGRTIGSTADFETLLRQLVADSYGAGALAATKQLGPGAVTLDGIAALNPADWAPGDPIAAALASNGGLASLLDDAGVTIQGIAGSLLDQLGNAIGDGLGRGDSVDDLADSLSGIVTDPSRAEMIAHTESARAVTAATLDSYAANDVEQWEWILSDDACPECEDAASENPYPVSDSGDQPPLHPRCRCSASPVVDRESDTDPGAELDAAEAAEADG